MTMKTRQFSYRHLQWSEFIWDAEVSSKAKLVGICLSRFMNKDHHVAWPSVSTLAGMTSLSERSVHNAIDELEQAGMLQRDSGRSAGTVSKYSPRFPKYVEEGLHQLQRGSAPVAEGSASLAEGGLHQLQTNHVIENQVMNNHVQKDLNKRIEQRESFLKEEADSFSKFWEHYPRKQSKQDARKAWGKVSKKERELATEDLKTREWPKERQFIPLPATYLRGKRWEDEIDTSSSLNVDFEYRCDL